MANIFDKFFNKLFNLFWISDNMRENYNTFYHPNIDTINKRKTWLQISNKLLIWFVLYPKKYRLFNKWISLGSTYYTAYTKAKNRVPFFATERQRDQWIREQKLKKILNG